MTLMVVFKKFFLRGSGNILSNRRTAAVVQERNSCLHSTCPPTSTLLPTQLQVHWGRRASLLSWASTVRVSPCPALPQSCSMQVGWRRGCEVSEGKRSFSSFQQLPKPADEACTDEAQPAPLIPWLVPPYWFHQKGGEEMVLCPVVPAMGKSLRCRLSHWHWALLPFVPLSFSLSPGPTWFCPVLGWLYAWLQYQLFHFLPTSPPPSAKSSCVLSSSPFP